MAHPVPVTANPASADHQHSHAIGVCHRHIKLGQVSQYAVLSEGTFHRTWPVLVRDSTLLISTGRRYIVSFRTTSLKRGNYTPESHPEHGDDMEANYPASCPSNRRSIVLFTDMIGPCCPAKAAVIDQAVILLQPLSYLTEPMHSTSTPGSTANFPSTRTPSIPTLVGDQCRSRSLDLGEGGNKLGWPLRNFLQLLVYHQFESGVVNPIKPQANQSQKYALYATYCWITRTDYCPAEAFQSQQHK